MTAQTSQDVKSASRRVTVLHVAAFCGIALASYIVASTGFMLPFGLPKFAAYAITWLLLAVACAAALALLHRFHRPAVRHAARHTKRGAVAGFNAGCHHGGRLATYLKAKAESRWQARTAARHAGPQSWVSGFLTRRPDGKPEIDQDGNKADPAASPSTEGTPMALNQTGRHTGPGFADHTFDKCSPELCGEQRGASARKFSRITPERRARRTASSTGANVPSEWASVVASAADFEAESDEHLLDWMKGQVAGAAAYAEALIEAYETAINTTGLDPKGLAALHDVADAQAHAAEMMSGARIRFADHYELPREFAANGGLMPHDGRWVTGEGA